MDEVQQVVQLDVRLRRWKVQLQQADRLCHSELQLGHVHGLHLLGPQRSKREEQVGERQAHGLGKVDQPAHCHGPQRPCEAQHRQGGGARGVGARIAGAWLDKIANAQA